MHLRQYEIVTDKDKLSVDLQEVFMKYKTIKKWAYVLHDKDNTRPHYHIYINFGNNGVDSKLVSTWFNVPENFISKIKGRTSDMLEYLTHHNDTQQHKFQYDLSEVVANFNVEKVIQTSKVLGDWNNYSYAQQLAYIDSLPISEKVKSFSKLEQLWRMQCKLLGTVTDRQISVMFVCGKGGTGKTYYSKKLLESMNYDYCVSSSSNDPFQDYLGQKGMILDDLRDTSFELADLLKILDNNTSSSVKSRFANKVFNGKMIIITSSVPLNYWYREYRFNSNDSLEQLYRRISTYVQVTDEFVTVFKQVGKDGKPDGLGKIYKNALYQIKKQPKVENIDILSEFDKICKPDTTSFC